jgi:hypothetical protein
MSLNRRLTLWGEAQIGLETLEAKIRVNQIRYRKFQRDGFEYILNPDTDELHDIRTEKFSGSHNLEIANLENFFGITNIGTIPIHSHLDGTEIPLYGLRTDGFPEIYRLNKCKFCFPRLRRRLRR